MWCCSSTVFWEVHQANSFRKPLIFCLRCYLVTSWQVGDLAFPDIHCFFPQDFNSSMHACMHACKSCGPGPVKACSVGFNVQDFEEIQNMRWSFGSDSRFVEQPAWTGSILEPKANYVNVVLIQSSQVKNHRIDFFYMNMVPLWNYIHLQNSTWTCMKKWAKTQQISYTYNI